MRIAFALLLVLSTTAHAQSVLVDDPHTSGVLLGAELGGAFVDGDPGVQGALVVGAGTDLAAVRLRVPAFVRVYDAPPVAADNGACRFVRCTEWQAKDGGINTAVLSRLVDDARLFRPGDFLHVRIAPLFLTLGQGQLVNRLSNAIVVDGRRSGLRLAMRLPWQRTEVDVFSTSAFAPIEVLGARVALAPFGSGVEDGVPAQLLGRLRLAAEAAGEPLAPTQHRPSTLLLSFAPDTRPVLALSTSASWALLPAEDAVQVTPYLATSLLSRVDDTSWWPGVGGSIGMDASVTLEWISALLALSVDANSAGHRTGYFSTLHDVERTRALGSTRTTQPFLSTGLADAALPPGFGGQVRAELALWQAIYPSVRLRIDPAAEANALELGLSAQAFDFRLGARLLRRGFADLDGVFGADARTIAIVDANYTITSRVPFYVFARATRSLRVDPDDAEAFTAHLDATIGVGTSVVLSPGF